MTVARYTAVAEPAQPISEVLAAPGSAERARDRRFCLIAVVVLAVAYLVLQNGRWASGPDTAFYISVARSIAQGNGFVFNGANVGRIPPLWPSVLALGMKISPSFWFLNLIPAACLIAAGGFWYYALRRFASPGKALAAVVLSGTLWLYYTGAVHLRTEALFCLALAPAVLLAMQIAEDRPGAWRIALLVLLCMALVSIRWAGLAMWALVAATLVRREGPMQFRQWLALGLTFGMTLACFLGTRLILANLPDPVPLFDIDNEKKGKLLPDDPEAGNMLKPQAIFTQKGLIAIATSLANSGKWISSLFWMPMHWGIKNKTVGLGTNLIGWILIALLAATAWRDGKRRRMWLWIGIFIYCGAMIYRVRLPNPRYLVPIAPLLLMGVWIALEEFAQRAYESSWRKLLVPAFVGSLALCNGVLWGMDVYIHRKPGFYDNYRAGELNKLISAADYLKSRGMKHGETAVSIYFQNLGNQRMNGEGLRTMAMLTDRGIRGAPELGSGEPNEVLLRWAAKKDVRYYLYRPPVSPWRAHHFRVRWLQAWQTGVEADQIPENPSWVLYELSRNKATQIDVPDAGEGLTHVPGL